MDHLNLVWTLLAQKVKEQKRKCANSKVKWMKTPKDSTLDHAIFKVEISMFKNNHLKILLICKN